jgi:hypothetical protein
MTWEDKYRETADRVEARDSAVAQARVEAARHAATAQHAQDQFIQRVTADVVQPFLRAADSPAGRSAASVVYFQKKRLLGRGYRPVEGREWKILMSHGNKPWEPREPWFSLADDRLVIRPTGQWFYEIVMRNPEMAPVGTAGGVLGRLGLDGKLQGFVEGRWPSAGFDLANVYTRVEGSVLEYMVRNGIRPR